MKRMDPVTGRALECLAHAIEYIEDMTPARSATNAEIRAAQDAVCMLKTLNRQIFAQLPNVPERRSLVRLMMDAWERVSAGEPKAKSYVQ